jgi:hypothetical protein
MAFRISPRFLNGFWTPKFSFDLKTHHLAASKILCSCNLVAIFYFKLGEQSKLT